MHYGVTDIPGAVPRTSTYALSNATLPYLMKLADQGIPQAIRQDTALAKGVNVYKGAIAYPAVAEALDLAYAAVSSMG